MDITTARRKEMIKIGITVAMPKRYTTDMVEERRFKQLSFGMLLLSWIEPPCPLPVEFCPTSNNLMLKNHDIVEGFIENANRELRSPNPTGSKIELE